MFLAFAQYSTVCEQVENTVPSRQVSTQRLSTNPPDRTYPAAITTGLLALLAVTVVSSFYATTLANVSTDVAAVNGNSYTVHRVYPYTPSSQFLILLLLPTVFSSEM